MVELPIAARQPTYPDLSGLFPGGRTACSARSTTCWASSAEGAARLAALAAPRRVARRRIPAAPRLRRRPAPLAVQARIAYAFVRVEGDGVHEIPVGPIHAGIIEPGHFRFSIVGEKVLRLEERLGYMHKGIDKRFESFTRRRRLPPRRARVGRFDRGLRLGLRAGRRSGARASAARRARAGCVRCCSSASASPTTWATWARSATTPRFGFALAAVHAPQGGLAARDRARRSATAS